MDKVLKLTPYAPADTPHSAKSTRETGSIKRWKRPFMPGSPRGTATALPSDAPISRQEIACVLVQALGKSQLADLNAKAATKFLDDHQIAWWSRGYIFVALQLGIVNGYPDGNYEPRNETIRA